MLVYSILESRNVLFCQKNKNPNVDNFFPQRLLKSLGLKLQLSVPMEDTTYQNVKVPSFWQMAKRRKNKYDVSISNKKAHEVKAFIKYPIMISYSSSKIELTCSYII